MGGGRQINETLCRSIASAWRTQRDYFERIDVFPPGKEDRIVGYFHPDHYPATVSSPRIELRLRVNGDLNLEYVEAWSGTDWRCRWDRHESVHNDYEHFHPPPSVTADEAVDVEYPDPPSGVIAVAFQFIEDRVGALWDGEPTYPESYRFDWEYGPDIRR